MALAIEFATFCNVCFNKEGLTKIKETEQLFKVFMIFIENKRVINGQDIYLCLNCCEKLESYDKFKEMCLKNFIDFRLEYFELKRKLETFNDPNVDKKLRNFVETKVHGAIETFKVEDDISLQKSENNLTDKKDEGSDYNYNFHNIICKTEKEDCEDNEEYEFDSELDLKYGEDDEQPLPVEHIKVENDIDSFESNDKYELEESLESTQTCMRENGDKKLNECEFCKRTFTCLTSLLIHVPVHISNKSFKCTICNKECSRPSTLKQHQLVHTREKGYTCRFCDKTYRKPYLLRMHEPIHTGEKNHICNICNKAFTVWNQLKSHMMIHTGELPHKCLICSKSFRRLEHLKKHERVHTGEKPYSCTICNKSFSDSGNLRKHELTHSEEKPYICKICKNSFRQLKNLRDHERVHSTVRPYKCNICLKSFRQNKSLKLHKQKSCE